MPNKTIIVATDAARRLTKGYGNANQPIYVDSNGVVQNCTAYADATVLQADQLVTSRTFTIGATGKTFNGTANVSWSKAEILGSSTSDYFYRGDQTWSQVLTGQLTIRRNGESAVIVSDGVHYTDNTFRLLMTLNGSTGAQGIWSSGYSNGTTFTSSGKYLLYRDTSGNVKLYGNADTATKWATARTLTIGSTGKSVDGSGNVSWSLSEIGAAASSHSHSYLPLSGGTVTGTLTLSKTEDANGTTAASPALIVGGTSTTAHIQIDNNEILAKTNGTTPGTLYLQDGTGTVQVAGSGGLTVSSGLLRVTANSNTFTIGSQNTSFTHLYNSANIPFIFNNSVLTTAGNLGSASYPFGNLYIGKANGAGIYCVGSQSTNRMIRFIVNSNDAYGNGISIGGGGQAIIGGGESADTACGQAGTAGAETMWICNDGIIEFYPNLQSGWTTSYRNYVNTNGHFYSVAVHSAVWNDYAECRIGDTVEPGRVVTEQINGKMTTANERLMPGCKIISDTYGVLIGETQIAKTPIAVSGRVLVYPYQQKEKYELGAAVCSAPGGTVDIMTREEIMKYPERIIGTVSEIPDYDIWYAGQQDDISGEGAIPITVNGRIWVYVK